MPQAIRITEVGPRDGLQNESETISIDAKVRFINVLSDCGFTEIEVSSFVSPSWVPQLADAEEVFERINRRSNVAYAALVPNEKGLERALQSGVDKIAVFTSASETFSQRNTNASIEATLQRIQPVITQAHKAGLPVRAYVSCVVACPFEGRILPSAARDVAAKLLDLGADEIDLGDTIGVGVPTDIETLIDAFDRLLPPERITLHLHDTRGTALACAFRAMQLGVTHFDASCGGLGGCPYAPGAAGNLATEDLVYLCDRMNVQTGISLPVLIDAGNYIAAALGRPLTGRVMRAESCGNALPSNT